MREIYSTNKSEKHPPKYNHLYGNWFLYSTTDSREHTAYCLFFPLRFFFYFFLFSPVLLLFPSFLTQSVELGVCVCFCFGSVCLLIAGGSSQTRSNPDQCLISRHHPLPSPPYFHVFFFFFSFSPKISNIRVFGIKTRRVSKSKMNNKRGGNCPWIICVSLHKGLRAALRSHSTSQRCCLPLLKFLSPFP